MLTEYSTPVGHALVSPTDTIYGLLAHRADVTPLDNIAEYKNEATRSWVSVTAAEMLTTVRKAAKGLLGLGISKGDRVVIYSATCYGWGIIDFACAAIGAITVPIYETDSAAQVESISSEVNPRVAFVDNDERAQIFEQLRKKIDNSKTFLIFRFEEDGIKSLIDWGANVSDEDLDKAIADVKADDVATIVFTSGTTGRPKGAELTHRNFVHLVRGGYEVLPNMCYGKNKLFLFLPLAHCFARYAQYVEVGGQGCVIYIPNAKHLLVDLRATNPTFLIAVPRVYEKIYNAASRKAGFGIKGRIFAQATRHFIRWSKENQNNIPHTPFEKAWHQFYQKTVGNSILSALGGNVRWLACGGAPMNVNLANFFNGLDGITFIEGYGLTETAAPCCVNFENSNKIGTVGHPGPGISLKIAEDGELLVKGDGVFRGYYNLPEETKAVFTPDGWFKSGDLAFIDDEGFVTITGRKKNIIITAGGKNVYPEPIEDAIRTCPLVSQAVVIGEKKPFVSALVTLDPDTTKEWLKKNDLPVLSPSEIAQNGAIRSYIQRYIDQANMNLSRAESIRKFAILDDEFSHDDGTLTASLKVVRNRVLQKYETLINKEIYNGQPNNSMESSSEK